MTLLRFRARRVVGSLPGGSSRPLLVDTEGGRFIVKLVHGPEGPRALAAEWLGHALAATLGLPTAELAAVELDPSLAAPIAESELREDIERGAGTCLGLRELAGARPASPADLAAAPDDFALPLLWLDVLLENPDRRASNPNVLRWGASLVPIDYAASLPFHHDWALTEQGPARELGAPTGHIFERRAGELGRWHPALRPLLSRQALEAAAASLPPEWLEPAAFATEARQRAAYVAYLWKRLRALDERYGGP
ncbi:MAG TPA: HipA family kinase [Polyangiaceae bacterium]|nr:HipA family kinase [Polyangiaceae bacterium]